MISTFSQKPKKWVTSAVLVASLLVLAVLVASVSTQPAYPKARSSHAVTIDVPYGLPLHLSILDIPQIVHTQVPDAVIERISARALLSQVHDVEPGVARPPLGRDGGPVWIVRARGSFVGRFVPPGFAPVEARSGYILIADQTGAPFALGMP